MSVNASLTLPNQPAVGSVEIRPLGGNGYTSPQSAYIVKLFGIAGDVSGDQASLDLFLDPQFECIVSFLNIAVASPAAAEPVRLDFYDRASASAGVARHEIHGSTAFNADTGAGMACSPPPLFNIARVSMTTDNIDSETYFMTATIYNFRRDAAQVTPLAVLLSSLPRGFDITGPQV